MGRVGSVVKLGMDIGCFVFRSFGRKWRRISDEERKKIGEGMLVLVIMVVKLILG